MRSGEIYDKLRMFGVQSILNKNRIYGLNFLRGLILYLKARSWIFTEAIDIHLRNDLRNDLLFLNPNEFRNTRVFR